MFAAGLKIVSSDIRKSYIVTEDSRDKPETVEVWNVQEGCFEQIDRAAIILDIVSGAYVTYVSHNVTSLRKLKNWSRFAANDIIGFLVPVLDHVTAEMYDMMVGAVLQELARDLKVEYSVYTVSLNINDAWFSVKDIIVEALGAAVDAVKRRG